VDLLPVRGIAECWCLFEHETARRGRPVNLDSLAIQQTDTYGQLRRRCLRSYDEKENDEGKERLLHEIPRQAQQQHPGSAKRSQFRKIDLSSNRARTKFFVPCLRPNELGEAPVLPIKGL